MRKPKCKACGGRGVVVVSVERLGPFSRREKTAPCPECRPAGAPPAKAKGA